MDIKGLRATLDKDHVIVSSTLTLGGCYICNITPIPTVCSLLGIFIGAQLPDIDTTSSKIGRHTKPISSIIAHFGHRGFTHSLWALGLVAYGAYYLDTLIPSMITTAVLCGIVLGYLLHILEDSLSKAGIAWLYPLFPHTYKKILLGQSLVYVRTNIHTWFRYHSTDRGPKGRAERTIRYISFILLIGECILYICS